MRRADNRSIMEGRILWDALSDEVHFFGSGIEDPPIGMQYIFWLVGDENRPPLASAAIWNYYVTHEWFAFGAFLHAPDFTPASRQGL